MSRLSLLAPLALLAACDTAGTGEVDIPADAVPADGFRAELADGHAAAEHTEVAPGVFLLTSVKDAGTVRYVDADEQNARRSRPPAADSCYNYDDDNYEDSLSNGSMFSGNPSWYGVSNAWSYNYDAPGTRNDVAYEQVSAYMWSYNDRRVSNISVYGYVYANGEYIGYITDYQRNQTTALQYGVFDTTCAEDGTVSVEVQHYHSWSDRTGLQYLYLANTTSASVECCPA